MGYRGQSGGGRRFSRGGSKSRKSGISIDFNGFAEYAEILDEMGRNVQQVFTDAMEQAGQTIAEDTHDAVARANLPAGGRFSRDHTENAIIDDPKVEWSGGLGEMKLGFDYARPGAGGFLITGTPKMRPDHALEVIYAQKKYERDLKKNIDEVFRDYIERGG